MRTFLRAGAIAFAASSVLLTGAVAAQAAPTAGVDFSLSPVILEPGDVGHTGSLQVKIFNGTDEDFSGPIWFTEPVAGIFDTTDDLICASGALPDGRAKFFCDLASSIPAGGSTTVAYRFDAPAAPKPFARISAQLGSIQIGDVTKDYPALFRSTTGSVDNPVPYTPQTTQNLTATTDDDVTLTRQADGTFAGTLPVTVRNNNDAPHDNLGSELAIPAGLDEFPYAPDGVCVPGSSLPTPPGGADASCSFDGKLHEGESRTFEWLLTAPADAPVGPLGTATTRVNLANGAAEPQTDNANVSSFSVTLAG